MKKVTFLESNPKERNLRSITRRPSGVFSPPERVFNDDNVVLKMRNAYPIDEALQVAGQAHSLDRSLNRRTSKIFIMMV